MIISGMFYMLQVIDVGYASNIITMRLTHCGEDGFVLYIPSEVNNLGLSLSV